jgi:predicted esterase
MKAPRPLHAARSQYLEVRRTARYVTLGDASDRIREVWIVVHGYGQLAGNFIGPFADLDDGTRLIVAPEALNRYYLVPPSAGPTAERPVGATWMTREDRDHEIADYVAYLDDLLEHVMRPLDHARVAVRALGFSQGVATVVRWVVRGRVRVDELICWAGSTPPDVDPLTLAQVLDGAPVRFVVGSRDELAPESVIAREEQRLRASGVSLTLTRFDGGHTLSRAVLRELARDRLNPRVGPAVDR